MDHSRLNGVEPRTHLEETANAMPQAWRDDPLLGLAALCRHPTSADEVRDAGIKAAWPEAEGDAMHHHRESGLDDVWLANGFEYRDTPRGRAVRIHDRDGLHKAIAKWIVMTPARLRGQEVRFLRSMLGLSQEGFGKLVRQSRGTIARWEGDRSKAIPSGSDDWLRVIYTKRAQGDNAVCELVDMLAELDELKNGRDAVREARFKDDPRKGWSESRSRAA